MPQSISQRFPLLQTGSLIVIGLALCSYLFTTYIGPDEFGVRRGLIGGVSDEDFTQGRHFDTPIFHNWYVLPRTRQSLNYTDGRRLELRTKENAIIYVDVAVNFRVIPGEAHKLIKDGLADAYVSKVDSVCEGFLRQHLAQLTNEDVQEAAKREKVAASAVKPLNAAIRQYHVQLVGTGVMIRAITFDPKYEERLQAKQKYAVQAELDIATANESKAKQLTDTVEKGIDKDVAVERETWNYQIAEKRKEIETNIAKIKATATEYDKKVRSEADATYERLVSQGERAEAEAEALGKKLEAEALASRAGRTYSAIEAVRRFKLGAFTLNTADPKFLHTFGSMAAWRSFFLGE